jgi:hypothetical protein
LDCGRPVPLFVNALFPEFESGAGAPHSKRLLRNHKDREKYKIQFPIRINNLLTSILSPPLCCCVFFSDKAQDKARDKAWGIQIPSPSSGNI